MSDTLIQSLQKPELYDHPVQGFSVVETHISWIILTGDVAYKIKKPVDFGFLDFSTLELRRHYCEEEVRLNARYAPDLYLGVVPICGTPAAPSLQEQGEPIEYAVRMRQFDGEQLLSKLAERHELEVRHIDAMAAAIAGFHRDADQAGPDSDFGSPAVVRQWARDNFTESRPLLEDASLKTQLQTLEDWSEGEYRRIEPRLQQRKDEGFIRECHGDLHLGNMFAEDDRVRLFDCIEFNEELRWIDVMCEVAFVYMDLCDRNEGRFAQRFLNLYLQHSGDYAGLQVLPYYVVYRALVRAKVTLLRLAQGHWSQQEKASILREHKGYLDLAQAACQRPAPVLIITHGLSGSGKSSLAIPLAERLGAIHIRSDIERKRLHGYSMDARTESSVKAGIYTDQASRSTYCHMALVAADCLDAGYAVIVDATFLKRWQREQFRTLADDLEVGYLILDLQAPDAELRRRIEQRQQAGRDVSEADTTVLEHQQKQRETLSAQEQAAALRVDTAAEPDWPALLAGIETRRRAARP